MNDREREAIHGIIHRLETRWHDLAPNDEWHAYDRLPFWHFLRGLREAEWLTGGRRFVDLGCGIGTNLAIAHHLGWDCTGVEFRPEYAEGARSLLPEARIETTDIRNLDSLPFDLVFMYRPAKADELEDMLEEHVASLLQPGTVCFWPLRHNPEVWVV